jgi:hypothetical protein
MECIDSALWRFLGEILLNLGDRHFIEEELWIRKAIEANAKHGCRFNLGLDHALYAEFFKRQGEGSKPKRISQRPSRF